MPPYNSLKAIEYVMQVKSVEGNKPFKGFSIIAIQHLLGASIPLFNAFVRGGCEPQNIHLLGKAYSSHPIVVKKLIKRGYSLDFSDTFFNQPEKPYDEILEQRIDILLQKVLTKPEKFRKILLIDDGGKAIKIVNEKFRSCIDNVFCVEQTSRGARLLKGISVRFPIVNVAQSLAKTQYESPHIAKSMIKNFMKLLRTLPIYRDLKNRPLNIALVGYGNIGENVARLLSASGNQIKVFDDSPVLKQMPPFVFREKSIVDAVVNADVIIGCTGNNIMTDELISNAKNRAVLANMASSDIEFDAHLIRSRSIPVGDAKVKTDVLIAPNGDPLPWRSWYRDIVANKEFYLLNGGFPVNFNGTQNPVPLKAIQLTVALLLAGAIQAISCKCAGLTDLENEVQCGLLECCHIS